MAEETTKNEWLQRASLAFQQSTSFIDNNYRSKWEDSIAHFQSRHQPGSKYHKESYKYRSKIFRPKTRAAVRNNEAAAAAAFFSNQDIVSIEPINPNDQAQIASAEINKELLNYRMQNTVPWFVTLIGGLQDAQVIGVVASKQYWEYEEVKSYEETTDEYGETVYAESVEIVKDQPCVDIIPIENIRFHPGADWRNPVKSSPYIINLIPMYAMDVKSKMEKSDPKTGQPVWKKYTDAEIRTASKENFDTTRQARNYRKEEIPDTNNEPLKEFDIVWVHENCFRIGGHDQIYYTLGTEYLLSEPKPMKEVYFHGERPFVIGAAVIESHKVIPQSYVELGDGLQKETNEVANQRLDNVKLVLNRRYLVKRGAQVDLKSIVRNVAGSVTLVNDVNSDVREFNFPDVTSSSYQEQDRLNVDYDEIMGVFSNSSVMSNRKLSETVGGMNLMSGGASALAEYLIRTFAETWVEPVLKQMVKLEQYYETDAVILAIAAEKAQIFQKYGIDQVTDQLLNQQLTCRVNVGMSATNPQARLGMLLKGVETITAMTGIALQMGEAYPFEIEEIGKEVWGRMGYKDGSRFMKKKPEEKEQDPEKMQMMQTIQQMQGMLQQAQEQMQAMGMKLQDKAEDRNMKISIAEMANQFKAITAQMKEDGADRRASATHQTTLMTKAMDLDNPVSGEMIYGR